MQITQIIKKAKVTKGRTLEVELIERNEDDRTENEVIKKCSQLVHNDLLTAFGKLKFHLVNLCDLYEKEGLEHESFDPDMMLDKFAVSSFSIGGEEDYEGVTITGSKKLKGGKILNLNTPFSKYEDEDDNYRFGSELAADIQACVYEVEQYLSEGKYAVKQLEIDFENGAGEESPVISEPKKRGRKKKDLMETVPQGEVIEPSFENTPEMEPAESF